MRVRVCVGHSPQQHSGGERACVGKRGICQGHTCAHTRMHARAHTCQRKPSKPSTRAASVRCATTRVANSSPVTGGRPATYAGEVAGSGAREKAPMQPRHEPPVEQHDRAGWPAATASDTGNPLLQGCTHHSPPSFLPRNPNCKTNPSSLPGALESADAHLPLQVVTVPVCLVVPALAAVSKDGHTNGPRRLGGPRGGP